MPKNIFLLFNISCITYRSNNMNRHSTIYQRNYFSILWTFSIHITLSNRLHKMNKNSRKWIAMVFHVIFGPSTKSRVRHTYTSSRCSSYKMPHTHTQTVWIHIQMMHNESFEISSMPLVYFICICSATIHFRLSKA